jgi:hypothetical protein
MLDGVLTLVWIKFFRAAEASDLVLSSAALFMGVKPTQVSLAVGFLWRHRRNPPAVASIFLAFFSYYWVLLVHLEYLSMVYF